MLKFLATIGGNKPKDPLTDLRTVMQWMDELPVGDALTALLTLSTQVREFAARGDLVGKEAFSVLSALDERAQGPVEVLRHQYLQNPRMARAMESRLWNGVHIWYQDIMPAYHRLIMTYIANPGASKISGAVPVMTGRLIRYFSLDTRWNYYRYTDANAKLWKRLHNLYHFAEHEQFDRRSMVLYPGEEATHVASLYLEMLMLETLNTGSLTPRQIHLVERWLPMLTRDIHIERDFSLDRHVFYVDLSENRGARRVRRLRTAEHLRFWSTHEIKAQLDDARRRLATGELPARLGFTEDCRVPACIELIERVAKQWSPVAGKRVQRVHERRDSMKSIEVLYGLSDISRNVHADNAELLRRKAGGEPCAIDYAEMIDPRLYRFVTDRLLERRSAKSSDPIEPVPARERWVMENESDGGYGAHVKEQEDDWVQLGKLVALKPETRSHWVVGVVRRLRRVDSAQRYVGIEVIATYPLALILRSSEEETLSLVGDIPAPSGALTANAILFVKGREGEPDSLIVQSEAFTRNREVWFKFEERLHKIRFAEVVERGDDWQRVTYKVIESEASPLASANSAPNSAPTTRRYP